MYEFKYKDFNVEVIYKKSLKHTYISIPKKQHVLIKTFKTSKFFIIELLKKREIWIQKSFLKLSLQKEYTFILQKEVLLFGKVYTIQDNEVIYMQKALQKIRINSEENILKCYDNYYKKQAQIYINKRVVHFANVMNLEYKEIKYRKMRRRWGSCSSTKIITFNTELMKVKKEFIDYVVVHELAHLVYMNHSQKFHTLVKNYLPNSDNLEQQLIKYS